MRIIQMCTHGKKHTQWKGKRHKCIYTQSSTHTLREGREGENMNGDKNCERKTNEHLYAFFGTGSKRELLELLSHELHYTDCCSRLHMPFVCNVIRLMYVDAVKTNSFGLRSRNWIYARRKCLVYMMISTANSILNACWKEEQRFQVQWIQTRYKNDFACWYWSSEIASKQ